MQLTLASPERRGLCQTKSGSRLQSRGSAWFFPLTDVLQIQRAKYYLIQLKLQPLQVQGYSSSHNESNINQSNTVSERDAKKKSPECYMPSGIPSHKDHHRRVDSQRLVGRTVLTSATRVACGSGSAAKTWLLHKWHAHKLGSFYILPPTLHLQREGRISGQLNLLLHAHQEDLEEKTGTIL